MALWNARNDPWINQNVDVCVLTVRGGDQSLAWVEPNTDNQSALVEQRRRFLYRDDVEYAYHWPYDRARLVAQALCVLNSIEEFNRNI